MGMTEEYRRLVNRHVYEPKVFKDVTDDIAPIINTIKEYVSTNNTSGLNIYLSTLSSSILEAIEATNITAKDINAIEEETRNIECLAIEGVQSIFYVEEEPVDFALINQDVWIGDWNYEKYIK